MYLNFKFLPSNMQNRLRKERESFTHRLTMLLSVSSHKQPVRREFAFKPHTDFLWRKMETEAPSSLFLPLSPPLFHHSSLPPIPLPFLWFFSCLLLPCSLFSSSSSSGLNQSRTSQLCLLSFQPSGPQLHANVLRAPETRSLSTWEHKHSLTYR